MMDTIEDLTAHLRSVVTKGNGGQLSIQHAAGRLGLTVRTLQRRLAEGGFSYSTLRDRVRLEEACRLISRTDVRLIDVAYLLGFSDPGHFSRAFRGWTGIPPRSFRQRMSREDRLGRHAGFDRPDADKQTRAPYGCRGVFIDMGK
jgi:AraC-like DNA-binding protein